MVKFEDLDLDRIVEEVLGGAELDRETAAAILNCPDERLNDLLGATLKVREAKFAERVSRACCAMRAVVSARSIAAIVRSPSCPRPTSRCTSCKASSA